MAVLKKIKFGTGTATPIAQTIVTAASESVLSVVGTNTGIDDNDNPSYAVDLNISADGTLVKDTTGASPVLKVGTVPAAQVSVAAGGHNASADPADNKTFVGDDVEEVLLELNDKINQTGNVARTYTVVDDTANVQDLPTNVSKRYRLQETIGTQSPTLVGANIDIPKDSSLKEVYLGASTDTINATTGVITKNTVTDPQSMNFAYQLADGTYELVKIDVSKFLTESEFGDGLEVSNAGVVSVNAGNGLGFDASDPKKVQVVVDSNSADAENFLSVGADGIKISGVQDAIDAAIAVLDFTTDAAVAGQYVAAIEETDGVVAVKTRANVSEAVLNNYSKGTDDAAVAATDTINQAISKLENQIDAVAEAADDAHTVVEHARGNTHVTVSGDTNANGGTTYTVSETNIADADDLADEITRAQTAEGAIDTAVGLTKASGSETRSFTPTTNYGGSGASAATSVMDNMQKLDTQLKTISDNLAAIQYSVSGTELTFYGMTEHA